MIRKVEILLKSMTGYGRGEFQTERHNLIIEMRSVNHRFCEIIIRMPRSFSILEDKIKKNIQAQISRGRVEVFITIEEFAEKERNIKVDKGLALSYYNALKELKSLLLLEGEPNLNMVVKFPEVIRLEEAPEDIEVIWSGLAKALEQSVNALKESRAMEGERLEKDIVYRIEQVKGIVREIGIRAPLVVGIYANRLRERLKEMLVNGEVDETRLAMEVALLADRSNITEELVRLKSHLEQFNYILKSEEAVGRQLDFMVQEINREINTVGSKANDYQIAHYVIGIKSEIEKIREQIQNIE